MKKSQKFIIIPLLLFLLLPLMTAYGFDIIPSKDYPFPDDSELPPILYVGVPMECGEYKIQLMAQPIVSKSMHAIVADDDMKYMILRVGITNNGEETVGWLTPDSFELQEYYRNRIYGKTRLNSLMSARISAGYSLKTFYNAIEPGQMLLTPLVFDVFPEADGWILTFSPHVFGEEANGSVQFRLPKALIQ